MDETTYTPDEAIITGLYEVESGPDSGSKFGSPGEEKKSPKRLSAIKKLGEPKGLSQQEKKATRSILEILIALGENPYREGLLDTPKRVVKSWRELYKGYNEDPREILSTVFEDGYCEEMVILKDVQFQSMCEHHMLPFIGTAHMAYIPNGRVVGLSKLARLVDCFARRLQIQEKMTMQIAQSLQEHLNPLGVAVIIKAHHQCMSCRGVRKSGATMMTSSMLGDFKTQSELRGQFLQMISGQV